MIDPHWCLAVILTSHIGKFQYTHRWWTHSPVAKWMDNGREAEPTSTFSSMEVEVSCECA